MPVRLGDPGAAGLEHFIARVHRMAFSPCQIGARSAVAIIIIGGRIDPAAEHRGDGGGAAGVENGMLRCLVLYHTLAIEFRSMATPKHAGARRLEQIGFETR